MPFYHHNPDFFNSQVRHHKWPHSRFRLYFQTRWPFFSCLWLITASLTAQTTPIITLSSISDRVRTYHPDLAAARLQFQEALGRVKQSGRHSNPEWETALEHNTRSSEGRMELGISQRFPLTKRLQLEKEVSLTELKAAEAEVREVERQLTTKARTAMIEVLATRQRRDLLRAQVVVSQEFADLTATIAAKGEGSALDAGQAKLEATGLALEIRQLDAEEIAHVGELKPLLGMRAGEALQISGTLPIPAPPITAYNSNQRADLQAARLNAQAAAQGVNLELARRYDDIEVGIFTAVDRMKDEPRGYCTDTTVGLRFKVALPFWNKNEGAIQEAKARLQRREKETIALDRSIQLEAEAALAEMTEWQRLISDINATLLPLAQEQCNIAEHSYRSGQGDIQSVLRSRAKQLELSAAKLDALRKFHLARVRHDAALGHP